MNNSLQVCEIFKSIQGESTFAGQICSFIRLSGCNLSCLYCDTLYAFDEGTAQSIEHILKTIKTHNTMLVEITGGEPLLQQQTPALCDALLKEGYTVLVETNGSCDISTIPELCHRIVDVKCPGSGMGHSFLNGNYQALTVRDELKFVISDRQDFDWAYNLVLMRSLNKQVTVLFSPNTNSISAADLSSWILEVNAPVRLGIQLHKIIWGDKRGV
jgi:7-carboxy-7-deazaguanine synthase